MSDRPRARGKLAIELSPPPPSDDAHDALPSEAEPIELCALLIGVSSFGDGLPGLPGAVRDVSALQLALGRGALGPCRVQLLLDPDQQLLAREVEAFCDSLAQSPLATGLIYIATHGVYKDEAYHLCLRDSAKSDGQIEQSLAFAELRRWLAPCQTYPMVMCLDSCRGFEDAAHSPSVAPQRREDIALLGHRWGLISAAAPGQLAWEYVDDEGSTHGVFARALLDEIEAPADPTASGLTLSTLHEGIRVRCGQILQQHPAIPSQDPVLFANYVQDIRVGRWPWSSRWQQLRGRFCQQLQFATLYSQPAPTPGPESCLIRPAEPAAPRQDLSLWGLQNDWKGFARGDGTIAQIVVQEHPHLDDMVAATGFFLSSLGLSLPPSLVGLAVYAHCLRTMAFPLSHRLERTLAGHWMALAAMADTTTDEGTKALADRWCDLFGHFLQRADRDRSAHGSARESLDELDAIQVVDSADGLDRAGSMDSLPAIEALPGLAALDPFGPFRGLRWAPEQAWLAQQREAFGQAVKAGRRWAEGLRGQAIDESWSVLCAPHDCLHPHEWWLEQLHLERTLEQRQRALLLRHHGPDRWVLCVHPDAEARLHAALPALQEQEASCLSERLDPTAQRREALLQSRTGESFRAWRWIEGLRLPTLASPLAGSLCPPGVILATCAAALGAE